MERVTLDSLARLEVHDLRKHRDSGHAALAQSNHAVPVTVTGLRRARVRVRHLTAQAQQGADGHGRVERERVQGQEDDGGVHEGC